MDLDYKSNLWKIYSFKFLSSLQFFSAVLIPFFTEWGKISFTQVMILQSWFMICIFFLEIPTGAVADYLGRKYSLILAAVMGAIGCVVYVSSPNFYIFLLGEFILAISVALMSGADEAFVYDTLKKIKQENISKKVFGRIESFSLAGFLVGALSGSLIASKFGLTTPMLLSAIPAIFAMFIGLTLKEPKTTKRIESRRYWDIIKSGTKFLYQHKILRILTIDAVLISAMAYLILWLYQPMLIQAKVKIEYFGVVQAAFVICEILILNNFNKLQRIFGSKKRFITFSAVIVGLMFILGGIINLVPIIIFAIIIAGGFGLTRGTFFSSHLNKYIPSEKRATVLSSISMLRRFSIAIISPIVGVMVDWSLNYTLIIMGIVTLIITFLSKVKEEHLIE
ncbi:MAG: MFS transporter [Candidatus Nanoarchaeia archaeon]|nr:MFS transporter [Candidatus Nanoarchaeia archaeon]